MFGALALKASGTVMPAAAGIAPTVAQAIAIHSGTKSASISSADGWATPAAGSLLLIGLVRSSSGVTKPTGWSDALTANPGINRNIDWYWKQAAGTESVVSFGAFGAALLEISGADTTAPIHAAAGMAISGNGASLPTLTPTVPNTLAIGAATWNVSVDGTGAAASSGWTICATVDADVTFNPFVAAEPQDGSLAAVSGSISAAQSSLPDGETTLILIKPVS
jgi:hypothetical protein